MSELDDRLRSAADAVHEQTADVSIPSDLDEPERVVASRGRSHRLLVVLAAAVVVALVASVAVGLTRGDSDGSGGGALSIEALAAATQKESARVVTTITIDAPPGQRTGGVSGPYGIVFDGLIDFRTRVGRIEIYEAGSPHSKAPRETELLVDGHTYRKILANTENIPAEVRRTKRWIESDSRGSFAGTFASLSPFDTLAQFGGVDVKLDDLGMTRVNGKDVHHYRGTQRTTYTPSSSSGPKQKIVVDYDLYVDGQNRLVRMTEAFRFASGDPASKTQIDFSDYGVRVHVNAPPPDQVVKQSDLPQPPVAPLPCENFVSPETRTTSTGACSAPTTTTTTQPTFTPRQSLLLIRDFLGGSIEACASTGAKPDTSPGSDGLCQIWGRTVLTGDDVTSAAARRDPELNGWCVTPTLTPAGAERLRVYIASKGTRIPVLPVMSHGRELENLSMDPEYVRSGSCWITSDGMTESAARTLARELS